MIDGSVIVARFQTSIEAGLARSILAEEGIDSLLVDEAFGTVYGGATGPAIIGIGVMVRREDAEEATSVLEAARSSKPEEGIPASTESWTCDACGKDVPEDTTVCWSCGTTVDGERDPSFEAVGEHDAEPEDEEVAPPPSEKGRLADLAWKQAVVGLWLFPPAFLIVSLITMERLQLHPGTLSKRQTKRLRTARFLCYGGLAILVGVVIWRSGRSPG